MKTGYTRITLIAFLLTLSLGIFLACESTTDKEDKIVLPDITINKDKDRDREEEVCIPQMDTAVNVKTTHQIPLTLTITNLESPTAPVVVTFYDTKCTFLSPPDALKRYRFTPAGNTLIAKIDNLNYGEYAFVTFQDVDGDGEFTKNKIGIPKEPYAFSNNFDPTFSAPEFSNCRFVYSKSKNKMAVTMMSK